MINKSIVHGMGVPNYFNTTGGINMIIYYLYKKTHMKTGLKYLGYTTNKNPHKYNGSGLYWKRHLRQHGYSYNTEILKECTTPDEVQQYGLYYSDMWNIVESDEWANLRVEEGPGTYVMTDDTKERISISNTGKKHSEETKEKIRIKRATQVMTDETKAKISIASQGRRASEATLEKMRSKTCSDETKQKISDANKGKPSKLKGIPRTEETKKKVSNSKLGKSRSEETKIKLREANLGKKHTAESIEKMKGKTPHNKGKPASEETKKKLREARSKQIMKPHSEETKQKMRASRAKQIISEETRQKMRESRMRHVAKQQLKKGND